MPLDLEYVVENREALLAMLESRGQTLADVQSFPGLAGVYPWALDAERRALIQEVEQARHRQRRAGEEIARRGKAKEDASLLKAEMKGVADRIKQGEARLEEVKAAIDRFLLVVPNVPDASFPHGRDAAFWINPFSAIKESIRVSIVFIRLVSCFSIKPNFNILRKIFVSPPPHYEAKEFSIIKSFPKKCSRGLYFNSSSCTPFTARGGLFCPLEVFLTMGSTLVQQPLTS